MKKLTDAGKLERLYNGVYLLPYTTFLGTKGKMSIEKYIEKRFLSAGGRTTGYVTGLQLANAYGFTTQNPSCYEVCSNEATTKQRKQNVDGSEIVVYQPVAEITEAIDKYSEVSGQERRRKIKKFIAATNLDFKTVKAYLPLYPDRVYRNIYEGEFMGELV